MRRALVACVALLGCGGPAAPAAAPARAPRSVMSSQAVAAQQRAEREAREALERMREETGAPDIPTLLDQLRDECDAGQGGACGHLGRAYEFGSGIDADAGEAVRLYKRGCKLGAKDVCRTLTQVADLRIEADPTDLEAAQLLQLACDQPYARACTSLGDKYVRGAGVPAHLGKATRLYAQSCDDGDDLGCLRLAGLALSRGVKLKKPRAVRAVLRRMCDEGGAAACETLGELYRRGIGITASKKSAFLYHKQACELDVGRCMELGERYLRDGGLRRALSFFDTICTVDADSCGDAADLLWKRKHYGDAFRYYERGCDGGDVDDCVTAGGALASGKRIKRDRKRAWEFFDLACEGEPSRCRALARKYGPRPAQKAEPSSSEQAVRKRQDDGEADKIAGLQRQCRAHDSAMCLELAVLYATTSSKRRDLVKAADAYNEACSLGETIACLRLGDMYRDGRGVDRSGTDAAALYRQACAADEPFGCWRLGRLYRDGVAVDKDLDKARQWLQRACDTGAQSACTDLDKLPRPRRR